MPHRPSYRSHVGRHLPAAVMRARWFRRAHGRLPPWWAPETFNEKINWRISFDRRPLMAFTCDKVAMKEHARRKASHLLRTPETFWFGSDVTELADVPLPRDWVLKPNHGSQLVHVNSGRPDLDALREQTQGWVAQDYYDFAYEWAYRRARRGLLVEEFIGVPGETPADLKVLVFDGVPRIVSVHTDRARGQRIRFYTAGWEPLPWRIGPELAPEAPPPPRLADMLEAAALLAEGYDMLRVDFYEHAGELWFGELTPYPGAGTIDMDPAVDRILGGYWTLPDIGPRRLRRLVGAAAVA